MGRHKAVTIRCIPEVELNPRALYNRMINTFIYNIIIWIHFMFLLERRRMRMILTECSDSPPSESMRSISSQTVIDPHARTSIIYELLLYVYEWSTPSEGIYVCSTLRQYQQETMCLRLSSTTQRQDELLHNWSYINKRKSRTILILIILIRVGRNEKKTD